MRPNILVICSDEHHPGFAGYRGHPFVRTPNLDRLAEQGMVFRRAYMSMSMCWPCRAELYTGLYPLHTGVCWNHTPARIGTRSITHYLGNLGYRVGLAGKVHAQPRSVIG